MLIRFEEPHDRKAIRAVIKVAFERHPRSNGREQEIVDALREAGALAVSMVADDAGEMLGHIAFSSTGIGGAISDWYGLGPLAVHPRCQNLGIGTALVNAGLEVLRCRTAGGCVVLGEPGYYERFGFRCEPKLVLEGVPQDYFLALRLGTTLPTGIVSYHRAFVAWERRNQYSS